MLPTSAMPGYPLGPQFFSTMTLSASMASFGSSMRVWKSSMFSKTTALPLCFISLGVAAEGLMIAPSGQRLPRSTAIPVFFLKGLSKL